MIQTMKRQRFLGYLIKGRGPRLKAVDLLKDDRLTEAVLEFIAGT
jgi:hypothetical protein